jgi:hypothetical protein
MGTRRRQAVKLPLFTAMGCGCLGLLPSTDWFASKVLAAERGTARRHRVKPLGGVARRPGRAYVERRIAEGDNRATALRCLKRKIARVVYRRLMADHAARHTSEAAAA